MRPRPCAVLTAAAVAARRESPGRRWLQSASHGTAGTRVRSPAPHRGTCRGRARRRAGATRRVSRASPNPGCTCSAPCPTCRPSMCVPAACARAAPPGTPSSDPGSSSPCAPRAFRQCRPSVRARRTSHHMGMSASSLRSVTRRAVSSPSPRPSAPHVQLPSPFAPSAQSVPVARVALRGRDVAVARCVPALAGMCRSAGTSVVAAGRLGSAGASFSRRAPPPVAHAHTPCPRCIVPCPWHRSPAPPGHADAHALPHQQSLLLGRARTRRAAARVCGAARALILARVAPVSDLACARAEHRACPWRCT